MGTLTKNFLITFCVLLLLTSCHKTIPPEITNIESLLKAGDLTKAEEAYDRLPEKLAKKNRRLLYELGESYLKSSLNRSEPNLRFHAMASFSAIKDEKYLDLFRKGLKDDFYKVQATAGEAMGELQDDGYKETFYGFLEPTNKEEVRYLAAAVLLKYGDLKGLPVLLEILTKGSDIQYRQRSAQVMGQYGTKDEKSIGALKAASRTDPNFFVRIEALKALGLQGEQKEALDGLTQLKGVGNPHVEIKALGTLAYFGDVQAAQELLTFFNNKDTLLRMEALVTVGDLGFEESYPLLFDVMNNLDIPSKIKAAGLLSHTGDPRYLPAMKKIFAIEDRMLRISLLQDIVPLATEEDAPFIKDLLPNTDPFVEIYAARALCLIYQTYQ